MLFLFGIAKNLHKRSFKIYLAKVTSKIGGILYQSSLDRVKYYLNIYLLHPIWENNFLDNVGICGEIDFFKKKYSKKKISNLFFRFG